MYLVSLKRQSARLAGGVVEFAAGEAIHTEDSHKYSIESFRELAARAGIWIPSSSAGRTSGPALQRLGISRTNARFRTGSFAARRLSVWRR